MNLMHHRHDLVPSEVDLDEMERRQLVARCNELAAQVRSAHNKLEKLEHDNAHLRYQLDTRPPRWWQR